MAEVLKLTVMGYVQANIFQLWGNTEEASQSEHPEKRDHHGKHPSCTSMRPRLSAVAHRPHTNGHVCMQACRLSIELQPACTACLSIQPTACMDGIEQCAPGGLAAHL